MAETPSSKSQNRTMRLYSLTSDGTYMHAASVLQASGLPADGLPAGHTWRSAGKLSDAELRGLLGEPQSTDAVVKTTAEVRSEIRADIRQRRHEFNERTLGYSNPREDEEYLDNLQPQTVRVNPNVDADRNG